MKQLMLSGMRQPLLGLDQRTHLLCIGYQAAFPARCRRQPVPPLILFDVIATTSYISRLVEQLAWTIDPVP